MDKTVIQGHQPVAMTSMERTGTGAQSPAEETRQERVVRLRGGGNTVADCIAYVKYSMGLIIVQYCVVWPPRIFWRVVAVWTICVVAAIVRDPSKFN
jgi:hypothetical protein